MRVTGAGGQRSRVGACGAEAGAAQRLGLGAHEHLAWRGAHARDGRVGRGRERVGLDDLADEVHRERFVRVELAAADRQLAGDRAADEIVQRPVHDVAERALGMREAGGRRRDAQVAQDREVEAAGERGAVDRGDRRQREAQHGVVVAVARRPELAAERRRRRRRA